MYSQLDLLLFCPGAIQAVTACWIILCGRHICSCNAHRSRRQQKAVITKALALIDGAGIRRIVSVEPCGNTALALPLQWWLWAL